MRHFKKNPDDETDDEETVEGVIFATGADDSSDDNSTTEESVASNEPVAGPSAIAMDPDYEPETEGMFDLEDDDLDGNDSDDSVESEEDALVQAIKEAKNRPKRHPPDIKLSDDATDLSFHSEDELIAVALMTGDVVLYKYDLENCTLVQTMELHSKACRAVEFSEDSSFIVTCGRDNTIMISDSTTGKLKQFYEKAHDDTPYSLYVYSQNEIVSGDEFGTIKVWDVRQKNSVCKFKVGDETISSIISNDEGKYLVCAAGDCITSYDMNTRKLFVQSEPYEEELTSLGIFKHGSKLVVGGVKGTLYVYNWGYFGYHSDIYPGTKKNIQSAVAITENILVTGCADGVIRAVHLFPHKQLGVVGQHKITVGSIDISNDGLYLASSGFDETVKFWDISYFEDIKVKPEKSKARDARNNLPSSRIRNAGDFFSGLT